MAGGADLLTLLSVNGAAFLRSHLCDVRVRQDSSLAISISKSGTSRISALAVKRLLQSDQGRVTFLRRFIGFIGGLLEVRHRWADLGFSVIKHPNRPTTTYTALTSVRKSNLKSAPIATAKS